MFMLLELLVVCSLFTCTARVLRCSQINKPIKLDFYIMQACTQSTQKVIARSFVHDLESCKKYSIRWRGMAFNFAESGMIENDKENCIIYECPEFNVTALKQFESPYHYYSAYARIWPADNMTCLPKEGLYMFSQERVNYTEAVAKCEQYGGKLMNIITEEATYRASNLMAKLKTTYSRLEAYVGLNDIDQEGNFLSVDGEPLNCVPFRSWAPGEPKNKYDNENCVTIDLTRYWRVQPCNKSLPFICEIIPQGPLDLIQAYCANMDVPGIKKECSDYFTSAEIEVENETCIRKYEQLDTIRERAD